MEVALYSYEPLFGLLPFQRSVVLGNWLALVTGKCGARPKLFISIDYATVSTRAREEREAEPPWSAVELTSRRWVNGSNGNNAI